MNEAEIHDLMTAASAGYKAPEFMLAHPMFIRAMTHEQARRGNLLAIAQCAGWRAEDRLNRHYVGKRMAYSEGREFTGLH